MHEKGIIYGYAIVSTDGQTVAAQVATPTAAGAGKVFREAARGAKTDRTQLRRALDQLEAGDVLMVTRLDRLAGSTRDLLNTLARITERKAGFRSLGDTWADTTRAHGRVDADRSRRVGGVREGVDPRADGRRPRPCQGAGEESRPAVQADGAPESGGTCAARGWGAIERNRPLLQCEQLHDFEAGRMTEAVHFQLTKLDVANRQLSSAIDLYFSGGDLVSAWTLGAAAYNILRDIKNARGQTDMVLKHQLTSMAKLDINRNENFFKHADRDQNDVLEFAPIGQIELLLFDAGTAYYSLAKFETPQMVLARMWFLSSAVIVVESEGGEEFDRWRQYTRRLPEETPALYRKRFWDYAVRWAAERQKVG